MGHLWLMCIREERKKRMERIGKGPNSIQEEKDLVGGVRNIIVQVAQRVELSGMELSGVASSGEELSGVELWGAEL